MLNTFKRWFSPGTAADWKGAQQWAETRQFEFKRTREHNGFVVEGPAQRWRLEWGPSQRSYIQGMELRLRGDVGETELQMLVLARPLMESMERTVFEEFTEELQTRVDTETPEEMRWLVLFPKLPAAELKMLRDSFGAVGSSPQWVAQWLEGPLTVQLQEARGSWLGPEDPFVLILQRGRLTLRLALPEPTTERLTQVAVLFDTALLEARRVARSFAENALASTEPSQWTGERTAPPG